MVQKLYIRPITFAESPQSEEGEAVRLAGGLVYASRFALLVREERGWYRGGGCPCRKWRTR
jgi:dihydropteroate synthase